MKYYIKVITGFREDQYVIIPMQEAHKAYYLFKHPDERGVFENGVALLGRNISEIRPEWNKTMGWNETHHMGDDDWNEIAQKGVEKKMHALIGVAKEVAHQIEKEPTLAKLPLGEIIESRKLLN